MKLVVVKSVHINEFDIQNAHQFPSSIAFELVDLGKYFRLMTLHVNDHLHEHCIPNDINKLWVQQQRNDFASVFSLPEIAEDY